MLAALAGLYVLARDRLSEEHARRSVLYLVLSPYAFALTMAYSEGPFLAFIVWMFVLSDRERDLAATPLAFAAGLTRVTGLALVGAAGAAGVAAADALGMAAGRRAARWPSAFRPRWLQHAVGDPLGMVHVQAAVGRASGLPADQPGGSVLALRHHPRRVLPGPRVHGDRLPGPADPADPPGALPRAPRAEDILLVCGIFAMPLLSSVLQSVGRFGLRRLPARVRDGRHRPAPRVAVHRAYVVFAPTAQIIFFTSVALGYRPP